jgi:cyanophycinase
MNKQKKGIMKKTFMLFLVFCFVLEVIAGSRPKGKLFIIGGGDRPDVLVSRMIEEAGIKKSGYVIILPMASELADSAIFWSSEQFIRMGIKQIAGINFKPGEIARQSALDSVVKASLIFISGGDQSRFMQAVRGTPVYDAIRNAWFRGAVIAGTSAGAAVMGRMMITGDELLHPVYHETFRTIESGNIEFESGLGLLENVFIDQHFVVRSRYNRLLTAMLENPSFPGIGIDEATAILVNGNKAEVLGNSQVMVFRNRGKSFCSSGGKMGSTRIDLEVYIPGNSFRINK